MGVTAMTPIRIAIAAVAAAVVSVAAGSAGLDQPPPGGRSQPSRPVLGPAYGTYAWPVQGPVLRGFEPPPDPFGPGHRGIDIGAPFGTDMVAAQDGTVAFAGWIGGSLFISIDHADGVRTTYSWLSGIAVRQGDAVARQQLIGQTGQGHPGSTTPHLHFGAKVGSIYIDPMLLLEPGNVAGLIHLAPLAEPGSGTIVERPTAPPVLTPRMSGLVRPATTTGLSLAAPPGGNDRSASRRNAAGGDALPDGADGRLRARPT